MRGLLSVLPCLIEIGRVCFLRVFHTVLWDEATTHQQTLCIIYTVPLIFQ